MTDTQFNRRRRAALRQLIGGAFALAGAGAPFGAARAQDGAGRRTITYYDNVTVSVPREIERIAVAWEAANSIVTMLGYGDKIVATTRVAQQVPAFRRIVPNIGNVALSTTGSSGDVNVEMLLALKPDILFVSEQFPAVKREQLERGGIAVAALHDNSLAAVVERTGIMGRILGRDAYARAQDYQRYFADNQRRLAERLAKVPARQRQKLYLASGAPLRTSGRPSLDQDWMDSAGAINVAERWQLPKAGYGSTNTNVEAVLAADPDVIVCLHAQDANAIRANPQWRQIKAVKTGRVHAVPRGLFWWSRETTEQALQGLWTATKLYPDAFADIDMVAETRRFYGHFYRLDLSAAEAQTFLNPKA